MLARAKTWARSVKLDVIALWYAARDPRVPWYAKALAGCVVAYALSPVDLIPDFVPILGYLDDLVIVPLGIIATVKLVPPELMLEFRALANAREDRPTSRGGLIAILIAWIVVAIAVAAWLGPVLLR